MAKANAGLLASAGESMTYGPATAATPITVSKEFDGRTKLKNGAVLNVDKIVSDPNQPRKEYDQDDLRRLGESMKARGQLQPIGVRWDKDAETYVVVMGERRWRAAKLVGLTTLAVVIFNGDVTAADRLQDQLIENCLREDLKPIEMAMALKRLMDELGISQRQLATQLHMTYSTVQRSLALLGLPSDIQESVERGDVTPSVANELVKLADPEEQRRAAVAAAKGQLRRDEVREQSRGPRATAKFRRTYTVGGFKITATAESDGEDIQSLIAATEKMLKDLKAEAKIEAKRSTGRTEAA